MLLQAGEVGGGEQVHLALGVVQAEDQVTVLVGEGQQSPLVKDRQRQGGPEETLTAAGGRGQLPQVGQVCSSYSCSYFSPIFPAA